MVWFCIAAAATSAVHAQKGSVYGTILDAETQETVIGANISVEGSALGATTDIDGTFDIAGLAPGTYSILITSIGYESRLVEQVVVKAGERTQLNVALPVSTQLLAEVQIVEYRRTNTEAAVLLEIKQAKQVVSGISAQQISKTLDRDAGQVVRRIPGVLLTGNFINIRGLNERYSTVMLHNAFAPSVETDVKSFSFDLIPSGQIDRILVQKSPSADAPSEWAGGMVRIFTKSIPDEDFTSLSYTTSYRQGTTFRPFLHQDNGPLEWTGIDAGYHNLPDGFPAGRVNDANRTAAGKSLASNWAPAQMTAIPDQRISLTKGIRREKGDWLIGNITALNYSNTRSIFEIERGDFNTFDEITGRPDRVYLFNDMQYTKSIRTGLIHNWSFNKLRKHIYEFKNLLNFSANTQFVDRTGINFEADRHGVKDGGFDQVYRTIYSGQFTAKHDLVRNVTSLDWGVGYGLSRRNQPENKRYRTDYIGDNESLIYVPVGAAAVYFLGMFYGELAEHSGTANINYTTRLGYNKGASFMPTLSVGGFSEFRYRRFNNRNIGFVQSSLYPISNELLTSGLDNLFRPENIGNQGGLILDEQTNPSDSYTAQNLNTAVYANIELPITAKFRAIAGVRGELNSLQLSSAQANGAPVEVDYPVFAALPSVNLSYNFTDKFLVRAAYGMSMNRPEFREIAPFGFFDYNINSVIKGNPNLQLARIHNIDLRAEYYPRPNEVLSLALFYKAFSNPIEIVYEPGAGSLGIKTFSFKNARSAYSRGLEVEFKKSLEGVSASRFVNALGFIFNSSLIQSRVDLSATGARAVDRPLQGQAPYMVNAGIFFNDQESGVNINLMYNVVGRRIIFIGAPLEGIPDFHEMPRNVLDLSFSVRLSSMLEINGGIADILNQPVRWLQDGNNDGKYDSNDQITQSFRPGSVYSLGLKLNF